MANECERQVFFFMNMSIFFYKGQTYDFQWQSLTPVKFEFSISTIMLGLQA